jgi:CheR methyltransferase, SAM binding domain
MKPPSLTEAEVGTLRDLIRARAGLAFPQTRLRDLEAGIHRTMTNCGIADIDRFADLLETDDGVIDALIANITVAETYFFREPAQFNVIRPQVLPDLRRRLPSDAQMRIWSAGCASGEEPYSLAILMEEEGLAKRRLFTDIVMPGKLTCEDLVVRARETHPELAVLLTSGFSEAAIHRGLMLNGTNGLLSKPYRKRDLALKVREILARS